MSWSLVLPLISISRTESTGGIFKVIEVEGGSMLNRKFFPGNYSHAFISITYGKSLKYILTHRTLPAFAIGLKDGVTSLEFDCKSGSYSRTVGIIAHIQAA